MHDIYVAPVLMLSTNIYGKDGVAVLMLSVCAGGREEAPVL